MRRFEYSSNDALHQQWHDGDALRAVPLPRNDELLLWHVGCRRGDRGKWWRSFGDFESQFNQNDTTNAAHIRDGGAFVNMVPASPLIEDTWYNIWFVINNSTDTTTVYLDATTVPGGTTSAQQSNGSGKTSFSFRNGTSSTALSTLLLMTDGTAGTTYFDEIYLDTAGADLTSPANPALNKVTAANDAIQVGVHGAIGFDPTVNDSTNFGVLDPSTLTVISAPAHGTATLDPVSHQIVYRHTGTGAGTDTFQYRVGNTGGATGTATVNVTITERDAHRQ